MEHYFTNNENLKSEFRSINYVYNNTPFVFTSDNGVFSKDKIDYGSKVLTEYILKLDISNKKILDIGCGYGFIGIVLSKLTNSYVTMVDVNKRCVHLTSINIKNNGVNGEVLESDAYSNISGKYDIIVTNPPIRTGKSKVIEILLGSKDYLSNDGKLFYVIRKDQGSKSITEKLKDIFEVKLLKKDKGFYIYQATFLKK